MTELADIQRSIGKLQGHVEGIEKALDTHRDDVARQHNALHTRMTAENKALAVAIEKNSTAVSTLQADAIGEKAVGNFKRSVGYFLSGGFGAGALELGKWVSHLWDKQ